MGLRCTKAVNSLVDEASSSSGRSLDWLFFFPNLLIGALTPYGRMHFEFKEGNGFCLTPMLFKMKDKGKKRKSKRIESFSVINPYAAGIDVGAKEMVVAVSSDICEENVRTFGTFTSDYREIEHYLKDCQITHVAMESTGVYWVQLFLHLRGAGFEVILANAKHIKNVSGRKDDELDAMWIQRLHTYGLITGSFQPDPITRGLRDLIRHRRSLVQDQSRYINRMIKALELMNIKVQTVISDVEGKTGKAIIEAILSGEQDAAKLASLADRRIKASKETLIKSLEANWNDQQLFLLKQLYSLYKFQCEQIKEVDFQIEHQLKRMIASYNKGANSKIEPKERKRSTSKNRIPFDATSLLFALLGTDLTEIPGINELTALEIICETGIDMSKWKSDKHFNAWNATAPNTKKSGGQILTTKVMKKKHRVGQALRMAANTMWRSNTPLGVYFRRKQAQGGPSKAILATASKMGTYIYNMIKYKTAYNPEIMQENQAKWREIKIRKLEAQLDKLKAAA